MNSSKSQPHQPSVTRWINDFRGGDDSAAGLLWGFLKSRLISFARQKASFSSTYDEEDVAIEAFAALCSGLKSGRYDALSDRNELWSLLAAITINRARKLARDEKRIRRGGQSRQIPNGEEFLNKITTAELSPEHSSIAKEECKRMLAVLPKKELQLIAILKVDGHNNGEIATILGCTRRSIQRRLNLIRDIWAAEYDE